MTRRDDDDLPIRFHPLSNGEYAPLPRSKVVAEAMRRTFDAADTNARRLGISRRAFLQSAAGMATTLTALAACNREQRTATSSTHPSSSSTTGPTGASPGSSIASGPSSTVPVGTGGTFELPPEATIDEGVASTVLAGSDGDLIVDVQTHLLDLPAGTTTGFGSGFPQAACGDDLAACFGTDVWLDLVLGGSDTTVAVLSAIPVVADPDPLSAGVMTRARHEAEAIGCSERVLIQGHATPSLGTLGAALEAMEATASEFDIAAWKAYTHEGPAWRLDDETGTAFLNQVRDLGQTVVCIHKGLGPAAASPVDVGPAAAQHPDLDFCIYHSGFETGFTEAAYPGVEAGLASGGVDRLIASVEQAGVGPGNNVYAELGSTWWNLIQRPDEAAHVLGKLLVALGPDRVLWGTDSIWYGSPQAQIEAFRAFQISSEFQERFGYPALTDEIKAKILGLNAARIYHIDPAVTACQLAVDDRAELRRRVDEVGIHGPTTAAAAAATFAREHPWFRST